MMLWTRDTDAPPSRRLVQATETNPCPSVDGCAVTRDHRNAKGGLPHRIGFDTHAMRRDDLAIFRGVIIVMRRAFTAPSAYETSQIRSSALGAEFQALTEATYGARLKLPAYGRIGL